MLFSIIIPVYNVEKYLDECLQTIFSQTEKIHNDCEILLIDDGSTDSSGKICDTYKRKFPEIVKVFHNMNHGLLLTRRFGFKHAQGDYVINCDSDDLLENDALEKLQKTIKKYDFPDVIIFNHSSFDGKDNNVAYENIFTGSKDCAVEKKVVLKEYLSRHSIVSVCVKIIKRTCIDIDRDYNGFGRISTGEDTLQSIEFFSNAKTYVYLNEVLYNYRRGSGMTGKFDENYYFIFKRIFEDIQNQKENWNLYDFEKMFSIKVLQTAGRAITQSRYKHWGSMHDQKEYLRNIQKDEMFRSNVHYLNTVQDKLQKDHVVLIKLLENKAWILICMMLRIKNILG